MVADKVIMFEAITPIGLAAINKPNDGINE